jgi:hypothetical protein
MTKRDIFAAAMYALCAHDFINTTVTAVFHAFGK